jgi:dihydroxy-acid dehydratase
MAWQRPEERFGRGYGWAYARHVGQADQGCDFDFLAPDFGKAAGEPDIF